MTDIRRRLTAKGVGRGRRQAIVSSALSTVDAKIAAKEEAVRRLQSEIAALRGDRDAIVGIHNEVEKAKAARRNDAGVTITPIATLPITVTRYSDLPNVRSGDGLTWSGPFAGVEKAEGEVGAPFTEFVNPEIEVMLRRAGAIHSAYMLGKHREDVHAMVFADRDRAFDDELLKRDTCEVIFDKSASDK